MQRRPHNQQTADRKRAAHRGNSKTVPIGKGEHGRIRTTNRALDAQRFSSVRIPRKAEVATANERTLAPELRAGEAGRKALAGQQRQQAETRAAKASQRPSSRFAATVGSSFDNTAAATAAAAASNAAAGTTSSAEQSGFDPIPHDSTFVVLESSVNWPPKPLSAAQLALLGSGGLDQYDRRDDELVAKKQRMRAVAGEISHPRGVAPRNVKLSLDDDSDNDAAVA
jgi:hypothetical protein